jgi:hypothetical protein
MADLLGGAPEMSEVRAAYLDSFLKVFGLNLNTTGELTC